MNPDTCKNMNKSLTHYTEQNKPDSRVHTVYSAICSFCMFSRTIQNSRTGLIYGEKSQEFIALVD